MKKKKDKKLHLPRMPEKGSERMFDPMMLSVPFQVIRSYTKITGLQWVRGAMNKYVEKGTTIKLYLLKKKEKKKQLNPMFL